MGTREVTSQSGTHNVSAIFIISPDGGGPRQIGQEVRGDWWVHRGLKWTPDGRHLSYSNPRTGGLHTLTLDGDEVRFIPNKDMADKGTRLPYGGDYSPDGRWFVYSRTKDNATHDLDMDLYIIPISGGTPRRLTHLPEFNGHVTWAPDSSGFYFVSGPPTSRPGGTRNIWRLPMDPETGLARGEPQQVTFFKDVYISRPKVLGDGSRIGFTMWRQNTSIQVADDSSPHEARSLARSAKSSPELSPDGQTVYYVNDKPGEEGIYAVPRQGGRSRRLTESLPEKGYPHSPLDLSPDGRTLAFCAKLDNERGLYTLPTSRGEPILLVKSASMGRGAKWSPDGSSLAYAAGEILYVIPGTGSKPREVARMKDGWDESTVRWSPDGEFIAAFGMPEPNSNNTVFVVPASGGEPRQLTPVTEWLQRLEWHPDGKRLTYHVSKKHSETRQAYLDGRPPSLLVDAPGVWDYEGAWAPDGRRFFFLASGESEPPGLYVFDEASGKTMFVDDSIGTDEEGVPSWSGDGKTMAWSATRTSACQSWIMENFLPQAEDIGE